MTVHHEVLRAQLNKYKGVEMQSDGDAVLLGFRDPVSAIAWCLATQQVPIVAGVLSAWAFGMQAPLAPVVNAHCHADKLFVYAPGAWSRNNCVCTSKGSQIMVDDTACCSHALLLEQALLGANWPNQLQKHKLTRTATLAGLTKSTANSQPAPGQENVPVSSIHLALLACLFCPFPFFFAMLLSSKP